MSDVLIVGGGVIGLTLGWELAGRGARVRVLDQGDFGREASWAGAGILPPGNPKAARNPHGRLRAESCALWPDLSARLQEETGIDNGYRRCGGISLEEHGASSREHGAGSRERLHAPRSTLLAEIAAWRDEGVEVEPLTSEQLFRYEPAVSREVSAAYRLPGTAQVRNPRHLKALLAACGRRGVELHPGTPVVDFLLQAGRAVGVRTPNDEYRADRLCVCSGAWTRELLSRVGIDVRIEPIRGQIALLSVRSLPFTHVLEIGPRYLVPRPDGRILVGSTEERAGFDKSNTALGVSGLLELARRVVPGLGEARFERSWAGLRPGTADGLPYLGALPGIENAFIAAGHFRSGLQMSPATAKAMSDEIEGREPAIPLQAFSCTRHASEDA